MTCLRGYEVFLVPRRRAAYRFSRDTTSAILIDATVVRMLLVPAVMHPFGRWNWWIPAALDRRAPHLAVDGHEDDHPPSAVGTGDVLDRRRGSSVFGVLTAPCSSRRTEQGA